MLGIFTLEVENCEDEGRPPAKGDPTSNGVVNVTAPQTLATHMVAEIASQPETWARAAELRDDQARLPESGARIAVVGCGTSWFIAQSYACLREAGGHGETDAFAASEALSLIHI